MLGLVLMLFASQAPSSSCGVSGDPAFAVTKDHPAQVGGGALHSETRARRYLDALRGPAGEPVEYKRRGSMPLDREGRTILDVYEVTHRGLAQPAMFYFDAYHFDDGLVAPKGFVCAVPFGLSPPGPDPMLAAEALRSLAIRQGASRDFAPIPLDADGSTTHGILLDNFRVLARAARAAAAAGTRTDPAGPPRELMRARMIVVAYPARCGDRDSVAPLSLDLAAAQGSAPRRDGEPATGDALARLLPGMSLPAGAIGAAYVLDRPRVGDTVRITYPEPCGEVVLPFTFANGRAINAPPAPLPAGQPPTDRPVRVQAILDLDGTVQQPIYSGGPPDLAAAAIAAAREWTAEPVRINGAPVPTPVVLSVKFR